MSIGRRRSDLAKNAEMAAEEIGMSVINHSAEAALDESQELAADAMFSFDTDESYDVHDTARRMHVRFSVDMEIVWSEPPNKNSEVVMDTVKSYLLKALVQHKYLQFSGVTVRGKIMDGK